jgi:3-deoxy-manno-octulosonate cytidylyltransferase (CMP-KDO synthetase)
MRVVAVIPARMAATRFPGKPLADIHGLPMIAHCYLRTKFAQSINEVVIATCDSEIADVAYQFGATVVMTSPDHLNAVDRTVETTEILQSTSRPSIDIVVLVQGDEPLLNPEVLNQMVGTMVQNPDVDVLNVMVPFGSQDDYLDHNNPKVVVDSASNALYISREAIPSSWRDWNTSLSHMQTGLFAFRPAALEWFGATPRTPLEEVESIDMLRLLFHGKPLRMLAVSELSIGVDTPDDLQRATELIATDTLFRLYRKHLNGS